MTMIMIMINYLFLILKLLVLFLNFFLLYSHISYMPKGLLFKLFLKKVVFNSSILVIFLLFLGDVSWADVTGYHFEPASFSVPVPPQVHEEVPVPPVPQFVPDIPVLQQPLIPDEVRLTELYQRLGPHAYVQGLSLETTVDIVYQQAEIEKKIEASLILDGIPALRYLYERNRVRGFLFYPQGSPLTPATLARYLREIAQSGTRQSIPYRRVYRAIRNYELFINLLFHRHG